MTEEKKIFAMATDPIYIGTGGYTIGRVDNTIVRDPITNIPKIPGSSLAGTWRYYVALELISAIKGKQPDFKSNECKDKELSEKFENCNWIQEPQEEWQKWKYNKIARIKCAGQDEASKISLEETQHGNTGHCGHCIVCKAFGFSKSNRSNQGMLFFSDLNILFFPVFTRFGVRWITSPQLLNKEITINENTILTKNGDEEYLNLGWLNLKVSGHHHLNDRMAEKYNLKANDIVIVPDSLISQIINSNLEVRTSVSIDPITGAAKEKALFTSEAIPRGTIFCGELRGFKRESDERLPELNLIWNALEDSKQYFKSLGIGGMTTRGFGRLKVELNRWKE